MNRPRCIITVTLSVGTGDVLQKEAKKVELSLNKYVSRICDEVAQKITDLTLLYKPVSKQEN